MISRNLTLRLLVAAIFGPALILLSLQGGLPFLLLAALLLLLSLWEFFSLCNIKMYIWQKMLLAVSALYPMMAFRYGDELLIAELLIVVLFLSALPHVFSRRLGDISRSIGLTFLGFGYLTVGYTCFWMIREGGVAADSIAGSWVVFLFGTLWIVDTAAYFFGLKFGKSKLSSAVSPNKTVVGFVSGLLGGIVSALLFNFIFLQSVGFVKLIPPALLIAFFGQLGDLVESIFKREANKKDSSNLIPGHGGVLDRFDSLIFAAPVLYLYLKNF